MATSVPPAPKKTNPLVWVLVAIGAILLLFGIALVGGGFFLYYKAKQAGLDPGEWRRNPGLAAAKMITAANPDAEIVKVDEGKGLLQIREKSTGKLYTFNFEDVKNGKISFSDDRGESLTVGGAELPSWVPVYTGVTPTNAIAAKSEGGAGGTYSFETNDAVQTVLDFYRSAFEKAGFQVKAADGDASVLVAVHEGENRNASVSVTSSGGATTVMLRYEDQR
jgi:hypothetical protein